MTLGPRGVPASDDSAQNSSDDVADSHLKHRSPPAAPHDQTRICRSSSSTRLMQRPAVARTGGLQDPGSNCEIATTAIVSEDPQPHCTAFIMSKIGRYIATTIPPTTTPRNTIINGSNRLINTDTAASTSSS